MANTPTNKELYARVKAEAKRKFDTWPSAYGSAWLVKEYKRRGGKYTTSKQDGGMSSSALSSMQSFYKDMQANKYNPSLMQNSLDEMTRLAESNPEYTYLNKVKSGTDETLYKAPKLFSKDPYVLDKNINIQTQFGPQGERLYKNIYELDQDGFAPTNNLGYSNEVPEGTQYMMDAYGNDYSVAPPEMKNGGGIPERYRKMGFTKVGAKRKSTRPGKKWMVLAKKGDKYKIVHGGDSSMKDFKQHGSTKRKKRFWDRMGGKNSAKANDPFSPLYWHKKFGTWQEGGEFNYDPNNPMPQFEMGNTILNTMNQEIMKRGGQPCYECGGMYAQGGTNNPGFRALPPDVQQKIKANMNQGGVTPFNANSNYYGERLEKFIGNVRDTAANNLFPDIEEEVMQMPQARYGMPIYQGDVLGSEVNIDAYNESTNRPTPKTREEAAYYARNMGTIPVSEGGTQEVLGNYTAYPNENGDFIVKYGNTVVAIVPPNEKDKAFEFLKTAEAPERTMFNMNTIPGGESLEGSSLIMVPRSKIDQRYWKGESASLGEIIDRGVNMLDLPTDGYDKYAAWPEEERPYYAYENYINNNYGEASGRQTYKNEYGLVGGFALPGATMTTLPGNVARGAVSGSAGRIAAGETAALAGTTQGTLGQGALRLEAGLPGQGTNLIIPGQGYRLGPGRVLRGENIGRSNTANAIRQGEQAATAGTDLAVLPGRGFPATRPGFNTGVGPYMGGASRGPVNNAVSEWMMRVGMDAPGIVGGALNASDYEFYDDPWVPPVDEQETSEEFQQLSPEEVAAIEDYVANLEGNTDDDQEGDENTGTGTGAGNNTNTNTGTGTGNNQQNETVPTDVNADQQGQYYNPSPGVNYDDGQAMYTDPNTGMVMNVPQQYFGQQAMYPQYGNPYLQRARYKFGPLGRNLRRVDLQYGIPGQQVMMPADFAANVTPEAIIEGMQNSGMMGSKEGRRAKKKANRAANKERRQQERFVKKYGSLERPIDSMAEGAIRGTDRNALMRAMKNRGIQPSATEGQRFEGYDLISRPDGEYEYRPQQKYGGANPYLYMYKQGGEYYMDEDTINMIMAMGGDIEFLD